MLTEIELIILRSSWLKRQVLKYSGVLGAAATTYLATHINTEDSGQLAGTVGAGLAALGALVFELGASYVAAHQSVRPEIIP